MKQRTMKRFGLLLCSCVMATTAAFAVGGLNANEVNANADATAPKGTAVGTLGTDGLYSTSMKQIAPVAGVAESVQNVYFEGFTEGTFFLTEFTGKNAPNFAIRATSVLDAWNGEAAATAGLVYSVSSEGLEDYEAEVVSVSNGVNTVSRHSSNWEAAQVKEAGKGVGLDYLADDQTYVMIVGGYGSSDGNVASWNEYYLFTLTDGDLELVNHSSGSFYTAAAAGDKAVVYPSIGADTTKEISFKYSTPATSVGNLVDSLSVSYKDQLKEEIGGGLTLAALDRVDNSAARAFDATDVEYVELDMASGDMGTTTWILTDFVGANAPNIAFGASGGFSTWTATSNDDNGASGVGPGMLWAQSFYHPNHSGSVGSITTNANALPRLLTGTIWNAKAVSTNALSFMKMQNQVKNERFIQIVGATIAYGADTLVIKTYKVTSAGALELYHEETLSGSATNYNLGKLVLYGNMKDALCGSSCTNTPMYSPSGISFRYSQPADTIENLIKGIGDEYEYKAELANALSVKTGSVTVKDEAGETISTTDANGTYTLPTSSTAGFIGYDVGGKLYNAGSVLEVLSDITASEVTLDLAVTAGARVRAKEAEGHYGGLRFETTVSAAKMTKWAENIALYGMLIPTDTIDGDFDIAEEGSKTVALVNYIAGETQNTYYITLTDVYYYNYNREFSARAYATVTYADGTTANVALTDYSEENNSRSVYEVAQAALADTEYGYSTSQIAFIKGYVNYVVDLTADDNGDLTLLDADTTTYTVTKNGDGTYTVTVKDAPTRIANAGYIPVSIWEGGVVTRIVVAAATLVDGDLVSENFQ